MMMRRMRREIEEGRGKEEVNGKEKKRRTMVKEGGRWKGRKNE